MKPNDIARILKIHADTYMPEAPNADAILSHIHTKRRTAMKKRRTLLIVVVLMVMGMVVAGAMGLPILEKLVVWRDNGVEWYIKTDLPVNISSRKYTDVHRETWGDEFVDALEEQGVNVLLPTWKPEGYEPFDFYDINNIPSIYISIGYINEQGHILQINITKFPAEEGVESGTVMGQNIDENSEPVVFEIDGREIWWGKNTNADGRENSPDGSYDSIFWVDLNALAHFGGWLTDEEAERMIQSME